MFTTAVCAGRQEGGECTQKAAMLEVVANNGMFTASNGGQYGEVTTGGMVVAP